METETIQREMYDIRKRIAKKELFILPPGELKEVELSTMEHPEWIHKCFKNNRYVVMLTTRPTTMGIADCILVQRHDGSKIPEHWSELQNIKNTIWGENTLAIEYYPRKTKVFDYHNIYWLWKFPEGMIPEILGDE